MLTRVLKAYHLNEDDFQNISPHLVLRHSARAKRLTLKADMKHGRIVLVKPHFVSLMRAHDFAMEHTDWIHEQQAKIPQPIVLEHGTTVPILGVDHEIRIENAPGRQPSESKREDGYYTLQTNRKAYQPILKRHLKNLARDHLTTLAQQKAEKLGKTIASVTIKDTKSRWGSCSEDGHINLSWRLIFAPYDAMDYVVAHEVAHLKHMDHSKTFWSCCQNLCRNYRTGKSWMRSHGYTLHRFV